MKRLFNYVPSIIFFLFIVMMIVLADLDRKNLILDIGRSIPHGDKIAHFILFGMLALLLNIALRFKKVEAGRRKFHLGSVLVLIFAVVEECSQLAFSSRTFDLVDMLFDLLGIGILSSVSFRKGVIIRLQSLTNYLKRKLYVDHPPFR